MNEILLGTAVLVFRRLWLTGRGERLRGFVPGASGEDGDLLASDFTCLLIPLRSLGGGRDSLLDDFFSRSLVCLEDSCLGGGLCFR